MNLITSIIIGFGVVGPIHHDKMQGIENVQVIGVIDIDPLKKNKITAKNLPAYLSMEELSIDVTPQIWDVCVPTESHLFVIRQIIARDPKAHIIVEKPVCLHHQIPELREALKGFQGRIVVNENYLSSEITKKVKEIALEELKIEPRRIVVEMDKNRSRDFQNGRFIDTEGALKYEGTHMVTILKGIGEQFCPRVQVRKNYGDAFIPECLLHQGFADITYQQDGVDVQLFTSMVGGVCNHYLPYDISSMPTEDTASRYRVAAIEGSSKGESVTVVGFYEPIRGFQRGQGAVAVIKEGKVVSIFEPIQDDTMGAHLKRAVHYLAYGEENPCPVEKGIEAVEMLTQMLP